MGYCRAIPKYVATSKSDCTRRRCFTSHDAKPWSRWLYSSRRCSDPSLLPTRMHQGQEYSTKWPNREIYERESKAMHSTDCEGQPHGLDITIRVITGCPCKGHIHLHRIWSFPFFRSCHIWLQQKIISLILYVRRLWTSISSVCKTNKRCMASWNQPISIQRVGSHLSILDMVTSTFLPKMLQVQHWITPFTWFNNATFSLITNFWLVSGPLPWTLCHSSCFYSSAIHDQQKWEALMHTIILLQWISWWHLPHIHTIYIHRGRWMNRFQSSTSLTRHWNTLSLRCSASSQRRDFCGSNILFGESSQVPHSLLMLQTKF